jgi:3-hydroxyisobutyrate dehydrogenase-like beta-hydroxyacid dehydrogenase
MQTNRIGRIAIIGFGEVGGIFGADFSQDGLKVAVTDILLRESGSSAAMVEKARKAGVSAHEFYKDAIAGADVVISAVTSSSSVDAATTASPLLEADQIYLDLNSVSPEKKREISRIIGKSNAKFVEAAVMAPVSPQRLKVPMLLGGSDSDLAAEQLTAIGMNAKPISTQVGMASAIKMCRSVLVKGLEQFPSGLPGEPRGAAWAPAGCRDARSRRGAEGCRIRSAHGASDSCAAGLAG